MALSRVIKCGLYRSLTMTKAVGNSSLSWFNAGIWKATDVQPCFFERKTFTTNHVDLPKDKTFLNGYEELPELQSADENVQRIFSLANASQQERRKVVHSELIKKCDNSQERKIAKMTVSIANLEDHVQKMNKDKHNKVFLQWLKDQRTKKLRSLMMSNFERYIELIKELNIEPLKSTHSKYAKYKFRRFKIGVEIKEKKSQAVRKTPVLSKHTVL